MKVYYTTEIYSDSKVEYNSLDIDITENDSLEELVNRIHEQSKIPKGRNLNYYNGETIEIAYDHLYSFEEKGSEIEMINDYTQKISDLKNFEKTKKLIIYIDKTGPMAN